MLDPAIKDFLEERKAGWLKRKIKSNTVGAEIKRLKKEADLNFSLEVWVPGAAKRAKQLSMASHPPKFTHPDARTSNVIARAERRPDGFLRTGNVAVQLDVYGNAAAMDVYAFLMLKLQDGKTILEHLEQSTKTIQQQLFIESVSFDLLRHEFLAIKEKEDEPIRTSGRVKQIYFPTQRDYHVLSILTASPIMFRLKKCIDDMRFSLDAKDVRKKRRAREFHPESYSEIYGLTGINFGGSKPQNISVMNSKNGGMSYLLASAPPALSGRKVDLPKEDFFGKQLFPQRYRRDFDALHLKMLGEKNHARSQESIRPLVENILCQVIDLSWRIRTLPAGWSDSDQYKLLPESQKIWLDSKYERQHQEDERWLDDIKESMVGWLISGYKKLFGEKSLSFSGPEFQFIRDVLDECDGGLR